MYDRIGMEMMEMTSIVVWALAITLARPSRHVIIFFLTVLNFLLLLLLVVSLTLLGSNAFQPSDASTINTEMRIDHNDKANRYFSHTTLFKFN